MIQRFVDADVVELVDTLASGASARKGVRVQVSPSVPNFQVFSNSSSLAPLFIFCLLS